MWEMTEPRSLKKEKTMQKLERSQEAISPAVALNPEPRSSLEKICDKFGKSAKTVRKWKNCGAPINTEDGYFTDYHDLKNWLLYKGKKI